MKTVLVISFSDLERDPRVNRQLSFLSENYRVLAAGLKEPRLPGIEYIHFVKKHKSLLRELVTVFLYLITRRYEKYYWQAGHMKSCLTRLSSSQKDLIIANDIESLPLALKVAGNAKVILDAHEYAPKQLENSLLWRFFMQGYKTYLCQKYIPKVDAMITVSDGIARQYEKDTGIKSHVIINTPFYKSIEPNIISDDKTPVKLIHHGNAAPGRKLEKIIKVMEHLDSKFELNLMLIETSPRYVKYLKKLSKGKNIKFIRPVPMLQLPEFLNQFDIGIFLLEPNTFNHRYVLPNKLFEFIQARLAVAIGPSPEMVKIVEKFDCGIISNDFLPLTMAKLLDQTSIEKINYYKQQSHKAAQVLNAENNKYLLLNLVDQVLSQKKLKGLVRLG